MSPLPSQFCQVVGLVDKKESLEVVDTIVRKQTNPRRFRIQSSRHLMIFGVSHLIRRLPFSLINYAFHIINVGW